MKQTIAASSSRKTAGPDVLRAVQLAWLAGSVFSVSAGYGALIPVLPGWLTSMLPGISYIEVSKHVGFLSGVYAAGVLLGAPLWGIASDRVGRGRILLIGLAGYVISQLLLLFPAIVGLVGIYVLRAATGFFVAAVVPVVAALVAEHTPVEQRARRFAWLGAMSLLGFLFGPALIEVANGVGRLLLVDGVVNTALSAKLVLVLSALLGGMMMLGLAGTLPSSPVVEAAVQTKPASLVRAQPTALLWLSGVVMFVLAGFELGLVLQQSPRHAALMLAECSLVMLGVNAVLFVTSLLEKRAARTLIGIGLVLAIFGLTVLAAGRSGAWMYLGVSLTSAGIGLVLPVITYLAAGAAPNSLGAVMGGLAAASGLGQTLGSAAGGWLFGVLAQHSYGWLTLPLMVMLILLLVRSGWWTVVAVAAAPSPKSGGMTSEPSATTPAI
ncbi:MULTISPECIES: MFS transporter [Pseudomonas]|uniref:MFS transporter n=1 Tax=Pseudomonas TaxID=286 RepID=UPI00054C4001|nr:MULTISPECIES: MFS transporter [Pseudomonas]